MPPFEPVIGLEVHAELLTRSKMFCACAVVDLTRAEANTSVCEICTGMPGTLPVINQRAIEYALRVALALQCEIAETSVFARKNYFYPDLPKGYQISMYELPLASNGLLHFRMNEGEKRVRIRRVHLEEDTGKLIHRDGYSLVDYNRSGVPLLEIVTEPDLHSMDEVKSFSHAVRTLLRYLQVSSGDMEKGVIRFEANVSIRPVGSEELGTRTEIKNLNSFRAMVHALTYEVQRQSEILADGGEVVQETVGWDNARGITISQRSKEEAHDYRYFPEPDLPPLHIDPVWIDQVKAELPELPTEKANRFQRQYHLTPYTGDILVAERAVADFFEVAASSSEDAPADKIAHWITGDLFGLLNQAGIEIDESNVSPQSLAELVAMVERGEINATSGKAVLAEMFATGGEPSAIVEKSGLLQLNDPQAINVLVEQVLEDNPEQVRLFLQGKATLSEWFFGQVMRATRGRANPSIVRSSLDKALKRLEDSRHSSL
ncbi:MAG: Asp-tRNA(Asn)/Glu-tRNA(Gln) amidotransferase subunit GatB [Anaerolineales bacterium]|nr:Asp-tRNA(Asn)/Glu-tRNA(Gln) amidotransferase subunit GatB [Anaerolineales bacterium]